MKIKIEDGLAFVHTPYHPDFVGKIKRRCSAKWDPERRAWRIKADMVPLVRKLMSDVWGECDIPAEGKRFDVQLHFKDSFDATCEGVYFFGKCLARATGRDSGARPGDGVFYLEGGCDSGGSSKYWTSIIKAGSVVMVYDVPELAISQEGRCGGIDYQFFERVPNKDELKSEKARLMARIKEIDTILEAS